MGLIPFFPLFLFSSSLFLLSSQEWTRLQISYRACTVFLFLFPVSSSPFPFRFSFSFSLFSIFLPFLLSCPSPLFTSFLNDKLEKTRLYIFLLVLSFPSTFLLLIPSSEIPISSILYFSPFLLFILFPLCCLFLGLPCSLFFSLCPVVLLAV